MTKGCSIIFIKRNKNIFFNLNTCYYYRTAKWMMSKQYICKHFRKCNFAEKTHTIYCEAYSTLERSSNTKENVNNYQGNNEYNDNTLKISETEKTDKTEKITKGTIIEEKEGQIVPGFENNVSQEYGYKYEKHEPTMFGDWSHNCRVTDF
ncbi:hypothetical protein, conserved [Plasmodium gonderi]|uniref:Uncharacterized protein n=1 Tax=Plasmodium gonderi TaxID=77519 RepID=A0A1Y1JPW8_PLAGO|nr:hypothetical protein, conserved [Plasmodium gonderi]GAW83538.1 hypothetical protein, conserved [Plasmodium gonderi]